MPYMATKFVLVILAAFISVSVKTQTVLFPDCPNGNINPSCPTGGIVINAGSANPRVGATPGWSFIASPQTDNVAWQIYSSNTASVIGNANCNGFTYGDLTTTGRGGNVWAVITLNAASNVIDQPLIGIFATSGCAFIYSLPNAIIGGPIYIYTTADDGSRPEVLTRIKLTNAAFVCNAPLTTLVNYILIGTMEIGVGNFVVQYAGYNSAAQRGCQSSFEFSFPVVNSLQGVNPINAQGQLEITPSVLIPVNSISPTASQALQLNDGVLVPQLPFGTPVIVLPVKSPKGVKEAPGQKISGPKKGVPEVKGKSKFLRS